MKKMEKQSEKIEMSTEDFRFSLGLEKAGLTEEIKVVAFLGCFGRRIRKGKKKKNEAFFPIIFQT
jgi:hypothetical protein